MVAPKPPIVLPIPPPMPVTQTPNTGGDRTQGASNRPGPGTGAGGVGTGTGSGGSGSGTGGGGSGGVATRPAVIRGITNRDYPQEVSRYWPRGGAVFIAVRVLPNGRATDCKINRSIGVPAIDQWTCKLVEERAFVPPRHRRQRSPGRRLVRLCPAGSEGPLTAGLLPAAGARACHAKREPRNDRSRMVGI